MYAVIPLPLPIFPHKTLSTNPLPYKTGSVCPKTKCDISITYGRKCMILLLVLPVSLTLWQCFLFPCVFSSITFVVESLATNFVLPNKVQKSRSFSVALMRLREYLRAGANPIKLFCFLPRANLALSYTHRYLIELDCST